MEIKWITSEGAQKSGGREVYLQALFCWLAEEVAPIISLYALSAVLGSRLTILSTLFSGQFLAPNINKRLHRLSRTVSLVSLDKDSVTIRQASEHGRCLDGQVRDYETKACT